jgi:hypothetical protein
MNDVPGRFTHGWGVHPDEVVPWLAGFGVDPIVLASSESLVVGMEIRHAATDRTLLGLANRLLYIGRRS